MAKKVLIIEDDKSLARLIESALTVEGFEPLLATDSDEGLDKAIMQKPDLILLDILLPSKSGFDCLRELKKNSKSSAVPVIILSNLGQDEEVRLGLTLGAVDYLVKADFSIDEVMRKIKKIVAA